MQTVDEIRDALRRIEREERKRLLLEELEAIEDASKPDGDQAEKRAAALARWRARSGTGHSDATDVSENKNRYLAEIYATK